MLKSVDHIGIVIVEWICGTLPSPFPPCHSRSTKISLIYFVVFTLLLVGLVPLVLTGWLLSERSGSELRAVENRYQIQLVQEKARQIEMFGQQYGDLVKGLANALEMSHNLEVLSSPHTEEKLSETLPKIPTSSHYM